MGENGEHYSAIKTFFHGKSVFITGATGFIGKQILEKLLRSCSDIDRIYILIRAKAGLDLNQRIEHLCSLPLFDKVRLLTPNFQSKINGIRGDLTKTNFDLSAADEQMLINNCHIVINSGASIRFTEPLKQSIQSNLYSVQNLLNLCKKIKQLQSIVHVSTAYIHSYRLDIDEIIYPINENPNILLDSLNCFDEKIFNYFSEKIPKDYPNTYTYTKSLAEYLISQQANNLPIAIIRPSIVGATWKEPLPESSSISEGWIDNYNGATNVIITIGKRLIRVAYSNSVVDHPMIPVDTVANMTIAIAWFTGINKNIITKPIVYNCCTSTKNKTCLSYGDLFQTIITEEKAIGFDNYTIIEPSVTITMNRPYYYYRQFFAEILPAYLMDLIALFTWRKTKMIQFSRKLNQFKNAMEYFALNQWIFVNKNSQYLKNQMNDFDKQEFNFDLTELNWSSYIRNYCIGIKKYLLKEDFSQSSSYSFIQAKKIRRFISVLFFFLLTWIIRLIFRKKISQILKLF